MIHVDWWWKRSKGRVGTSKKEWGLVIMMVTISCFWNVGKDGWRSCFINEGRLWLAKVGCRASLVVSRWFRVLFSVAKSIWVEVGVDRYGSSKGFGMKTKSGIEVFIKVGVAGYDKALWLVRRVD